MAVELISFRRAMYHALMGENVDGKTAAEWGLVNEAVPLSALKARVSEVANVLLAKKPVALKATKDAIRRVREMTYENAEDYLIRAQEAATTTAAKKASGSSSTTRPTSPASARTTAPKAPA